MGTLKISDLSVGDWVYYGNETTPYTIRSIYRKGIQDCVVLNDEKFSDGVIAFVDRLTPIPITAEVLEKNGFERLLVRDLFYHSESGLEVAFEDEEWMHTINLNEYTIHAISGVHHIQHLLRLYGCEKEINL